MSSKQSIEEKNDLKTSDFAHSPLYCLFYLMNCIFDQA